MQPRRSLFPIIVLCLSMLVAPWAGAQEKVRVKLGTLAPRASIYHRVLQEMGEA